MTKAPLLLAAILLAVFATALRRWPRPLSEPPDGRLQRRYPPDGMKPTSPEASARSRPNFKRPTPMSPSDQRIKGRPAPQFHSGLRPQHPQARNGQSELVDRSTGEPKDLEIGDYLAANMLSPRQKVTSRPSIATSSSDPPSPSESSLPIAFAVDDVSTIQPPCPKTVSKLATRWNPPSSRSREPRPSR